MEDKLHNDRLEEFLRRSLEGHSEDPPNDLWAKIANGIEATPVAPIAGKAPGLRIMSSWWVAAAAVVGLLVGQYLYFEHRIDQLTKELQENAAQTEKVEIKAPVPAQKTNATVPAIATETETNKESSSNPVVNAIAKPRNEKSPATAPLIKNQSVKPNQRNSNNTQHPAAPITPSKAELAVEAPLDKVLPTNLENVEADITDLQRAGLAENARLEKVWLKPIQLQVAPTKASLVQSILPIDPSSYPNRFKLGLNYMPMVSRTWIKSNEPEGGGPGKPNDRKSFDIESETTGQAWQAGISLEAAITPRFSVGTGLGYRSMKYDTEHDLCLEFDDRRPKPGGQGQHDHEHDFQYNLNTAVGAIEMEVRAESEEAAPNIPDDEKIEAKVNTSQSLSYITVPIYANYTMGKGRLRALAKGGIMLNFLQSHDFAVADIKSLNDKFQFSHKENQRGTQNDLQTVTVDYMAGLGLEYRLTRNASLRLEPMVVGALTSSHNNPRIESTEIAAGLNLGLNYSF